jgi:hypothetical protein
MAEILVKIMVELLSTLGLATKQIMQKRPSESLLLSLVYHLNEAPQSQICEETVWRK